MEKLQIIDSTTITLFSNLIFKGAGRNPKSGKKKGGIKVHKVIRALEGVASDIKFTSAATHDSFMMAPEDIIAIYKQRWEIETLFKQIKQNFPLHFFYGESANAIKIQIWVTLIANLLLTIMQRSLHRRLSFSNLATTVRITLMYYVDFQSFFENPEKDWQKVLLEAAEPPPQLELEF